MMSQFPHENLDYHKMHAILYTRLFQKILSRAVTQAGFFGSDMALPLLSSDLLTQFFLCVALLSILAMLTTGPMSEDHGED